MRVRTAASGGIMTVLLVVAALFAAAPAAAGTVRVGVLKFGTVNWELDVIKRHGFDKAEGIDTQVVGLASNNATAVALQAGAVDVIVTDWLWVTRQRAEGAPYTFVPYSISVGSLVVPADSPIRSLGDLAGKRVGIAGGPVDKSWLVLRALATQRFGLDLDSAVDKVFGAPPLLNEQILDGGLDAVINNWNFVAQLEAKGLRRVIGADEAAHALGITTDVPLLGYVFDETWAAKHRDDALGLVRASRKAKALMAESDAEWERLRPLVRAPDEATFRALRDGFRAGIPRAWGEAERADAARLFEIMARLGGEELVGKSRELQPGTFWAEVSY
ncbi:MAG: ABC transporter substrate-binding protein [Rhodospirillaceae bacterium]|nr:ABC transporter substrate-binding protein [Rhodospirillaceae bacterium]